MADYRGVAELLEEFLRAANRSVDAEIVGRKKARALWDKAKETAIRNHQEYGSFEVCLRTSCETACCMAKLSEEKSA